MRNLPGPILDHTRDQRSGSDNINLVAAIIQVENIAKVYRIGKVEVPALRGVSFEVQRGEFVSIVGPSGSGKSTLFYILGGLTHATSGRVLVDGDDFARMSDAQRTEMRKRKIGFVFQKFNLLPTLTARGNIEMAISSRRSQACWVSPDASTIVLRKCRAESSKGWPWPAL